MNESFKLLEDSISAAGVNSDEVKYVTIGFNADAHNWFLDDQNKYEWDGPKTQFEIDGLIEFYEKLIADHPLLELIEDPMASVDVEGYKKFIEKVKTDHKHINIVIS